ncbi:RagB/SusD domain-containing protein [bacterium A37T11]|nr:RagB/SusD domain-containing protein [bacterium A37T11]
MKKLIKHIRTIIPVLFLLMAAGCGKDYLKTNPTDAVSGETVFATLDGAQVALDGTYRILYTFGFTHYAFGQKSQDLASDLYGLDMVVHKGGPTHFDADYNFTGLALTSLASRTGRAWDYYYKVINNANRIIANIDQITGLQEEKDNIKGQALCLRAYSYFYLINFYQHTYKGNENKPGVPLYSAPSADGAGRGTVQQVYDQINADLVQAQTLLEGKTRSHPSHIDVRTVHAIHALAALQQEDYPTAKEHAAAARQGIIPATRAQYLGGTIFNTVNGPEYIWGVEVNAEQQTSYASFYSQMDIASGGYASFGKQKKITKALYDQIADGDVRKELFTTIAAGTVADPPLDQHKLRLRVAGNWASDYLFIRAAEAYLIEAEADYRTGDENSARSVLAELIQTRYPAYSISNLSGQALLNEILLQRRIELWGEGRSYLDIKRLKTGLHRPTGDGNHTGWDLLNATNKANNFPLPPAAINKEDQDPTFLYKIPQDELDANAALKASDQNP